MRTRGWQQCGSAVTQFKMSRCVLVLEFAGGLLNSNCCSNPELLMALLAKYFPRWLCFAACAELSAVAAILLSAPKLAALKLVEIYRDELQAHLWSSCRSSHNESYFLIIDMLIVVFLGRHCLDQRMLETWQSVQSILCSCWDTI